MVTITIHTLTSKTLKLFHCLAFMHCLCPLHQQHLQPMLTGEAGGRGGGHPRAKE